MIKAELVLGLMIGAVFVFGLLKAESVLRVEGGGEGVLVGPYRDRMTI